MSIVFGNVRLNAESCKKMGKANFKQAFGKHLGSNVDKAWDAVKKATPNVKVNKTEKKEEPKTEEKDAGTAGEDSETSE